MMPNFEGFGVTMVFLGVMACIGALALLVGIGFLISWAVMHLRFV